MIQEVKQWIDEIQILQQKLTEANQEREEAFASAAKWRNLYETEAKQRRAEANLARQNANALKAEIHHLQESPILDEAQICSDRPTLPASLQHLGMNELKAKLAQALVEADRLTQTLKTEQASHAQTRHALTTALGDTIDRLTQERAARHKDEQAEVKRQTVVITHETVQPQPKSPLLALPPTDLAQSRS
jgi:cell division septum initiation protein DivIVA